MRVMVESVVERKRESERVMKKKVEEEDENELQFAEEREEKEIGEDEKNEKKRVMVRWLNLWVGEKRESKWERE